ncbi:MAG: hypothetical protein DDT30_02004 [Dehalococcoidia bacterium]|nr:hypothetical protein [Bacillota bacterium]
MPNGLARLFLVRTAGSHSGPLARTASMGLVLLKHLAIEEQESAKGLVLRRGGNVLAGSHMGEKGLSE